VEALGAGHRLFDTLIGASAGGARQAFDALSGEAHASAVTVAYGDARLVQNAILTRLRQSLSAASGLPAFVQGSYAAAYAADRPGAAPQPVVVTPAFGLNRFAVWGEGFGAWGKADGNRNAAGLDTSTGGFILGADAQLDPAFRLGLAGGFTRTTFDIDGRLSSGTNESVFGALYGAGQWGAINLRLGASYAWHDFDVSRTVRFPSFQDTVSASHDGWTAQAFGELGYRFDGLGAFIEPFVGASVLRLHTDGFRENGGFAALTGLARDFDLGTTTLGVRAEARLSTTVPVSLRALLGWRHAYGDVEPRALLAFAGGASPFSVAGTPIDRDSLVAEAGLDWQASEAISLGVAYSGQIGSRAQDHTVKGSFTWRFGAR
jgi:outer membrane autotransporter protein